MKMIRYQRPAAARLSLSDYELLFGMIMPPGLSENSKYYVHL